MNVNRSGNVSSASESEATPKDSVVVSPDERGVAVSEVGGGKEGKIIAGDSAVYKIHLCLPGVPHPVDVMVSQQPAGGSIRNRAQVHVCLCVS